MKRMNRPMPAVIASLSSIGTASKTSLRSPVAAKQHDDQAVDDDKAHRLGPGERADHGRREERVDAQSRGECERQPGDDTEQDRHDARGQRRRGRDLRELQPAARSTSVGARQDDRVQHDDVGHRDERDHAAAYLGADRRPARRDFEEAIQAIHSSTLWSRADPFLLCRDARCSWCPSASFFVWACAASLLCAPR